MKTVILLFFNYCFIR